MLYYASYAAIESLENKIKQEISIDYDNEDEDASE